MQLAGALPLTSETTGGSMPSHLQRDAARISTVLVILSTVACADARAGAPETVREMDGDTAVVRTVAGSVWGDSVRLEPEISIGVLDGAETYMFGRVQAIGVDTRGRIFVLDSQVPAVRVYDENGEFVATLGRRGGGPGELSQPDGMAVLSDGRVVVRDPNNARMQLFTADLQPGGEWSVIRSGFNTSNPVWVTRGDTMATMVLRDPEAIVTEWRFGLQRISPDGAIVDTLTVPRVLADPPYLVASREGSTSQTSVPFSPRETWALHPEGFLVHGVTSEYRFCLLDSDGPMRVERVVEPIPVAGGERDEEEHRVTANMRRTQENWRWNGPPIPGVKPPYRSVHVGRDGRVWVQASMPAVEGDDPDYDPTDPRSVPDRWKPGEAGLFRGGLELFD
jgi:hypothetical protein